MGQAQIAVQRYEEALAVARGLVARDRQNLYAERCLALSLRALGDAHAALKNRGASIDFYRQALAIWSRWDREGVAVPYSTNRQTEVSRAMAAVQR
jgi:tetratricopeptide (TPR) repeat protein